MVRPTWADAGKSPIRAGMTGAVILGVVLGTLGVPAVKAVPAAASTAAGATVTYPLAGGDFGDPWSVTGTVTAENSVLLAPGGVLWEGIPVGAGSAPQAGDVVYASVDVTLDSGVTTQSDVLVRLTDGSSILAERSDLTGLARGTRITAETSFVSNGGRIGAGAGALYIELHNDTAAPIEFHAVHAWGIRGAGEQVDYAIPNGDFSAVLGSGNWSGSGATALRSVMLAPGAGISQSLPVGAGADSPLPGDIPTLSFRAFVSPEDTVARAVGSVSSGETAIASAALPSPTSRGTWQTLTSSAVGAGVVPLGATAVTVALTNTAAAPLRLASVQTRATRAPRNDDMNGDGAVNAADAAWLTAQVKAGTTDPALDYDGDGQVTLADVSYFTRFILDDRSEVYGNLAHLDFLSEHVTVEGTPMLIVHLYSAPVDPADLSRGYTWISDPQEGIAALDDVARAALVWAEHYRTYRDEHSYQQLKLALAFVMWMQAPNGDFDNFVDRDAAGVIYKRDSQSSSTSFSYWAARGYEAMATALPLIQKGDTSLNAQLTSHLTLSLKRLGEVVAPIAGARGTAAPALPGNDVWLSSIAVSALAAHAPSLAGAARAQAVALAGRLGKGIGTYQSGDFTTYPLGAVTNTGGQWDEWGSIQAKALALAGQLSGDKTLVKKAELEADSYLSDLLISGRSFSVNPNKSGLPAINYATASYVENYLTLYSVTGLKKYADMAGMAATWWTGQNAIGVPMFDQALGLAFDGITVGGLNNNSGAESVDEALRAILRLKRVPEAAALMTSAKTAEHTTQTIQFEDLYRQGRPSDAALELPGGALNDPAQALVSQSATSGTDEKAIYADALPLTQQQPVYRLWQGTHAIFVKGVGYNNVRIFDGGSLSLDLPVGGAGQPQVGDALRLNFAALVQFQTTLRARVLAVDASGASTLLADDSGFRYNARTWYSGSGSVNTTPVATVPAGTISVRVEFSSTSTNPNAYEGYSTVTLANLFRLGTPEVRYGSTSLSGSAYALAPAGSSRTFSVAVTSAGEYSVFLSEVGQPKAATATIAIGGAFRAAATVPAGAGTVSIVNLGRASLAAGATTLTVTVPPGADAGLDAVILYPAQATATYALLDGRKVTVLRDASDGTLTTGSPQQIAARMSPIPTVAPTIGGNAALRSVLIADPGSWTPAGASFSYQWLRDGQEIPGARGRTYNVQQKDAGHEVSVAVTASERDRMPGHAVSAPVAVPAAK
ncbi:dockerin type I repeat-containing protein [Microbacterium candidum]|uniref:Dockerin type I repeat-containing protein n=1 Tax=Microbacterium candidum TaxID=3041922 RepID=A0ABT7MWA0_9MICO|nr:dockerin type I repeat-containing protein [Microbacterium sp. ASV49]MDL9978722.1 dockerin type I repeat-containing protein [Microbacterium sp. ASV49]